jgi:excisionase family DNA binding protein
MMQYKEKGGGISEMADEYLTVEELCKWLKISRATVDRWRKQGMPFIKVDKLVRFKKSEIEQWLEQKDNPKN